MWVGPGQGIVEEGVGVQSGLSVPSRRLPGSGHPGRARGPVIIRPQGHTVPKTRTKGLQGRHPFWSSQTVALIH